MSSSEMRFAGVTFRACSSPPADLSETAVDSRSRPGRFNTPTIGAVYVSEEPDTAMHELRRTVGRENSSLLDAHPCSILAIELAVRNLVDLTTPSQLTAWRLTPGDLTSESMDRCRHIAAAAVQLGAEAIRWPSATGRGHSLALFIDHLGPSATVRVVRQFNLSEEALAAIQAGASVSMVVDAVREFYLESLSRRRW